MIRYYISGIWWIHRTLQRHLSIKLMPTMLVLFLSLFTVNQLFADIRGNEREVPVQRTVSGQVTDANGNPLGGVTVTEKGTANSTGTNEDGWYSLNLSNANSTVLVFQ